MGTAMPKTIFGGAHTHLVEVLIAMRQATGLNQTDIGKRVGKSQSFISLIESGQRRVDVLEFIVLTKAMGFDPLEAFEKLLRRLPDDFEI